MRVKTFRGKTLEELLPQIREELGPNAVVLGQRQVVEGGVGGFFGTRVVQVTAADRMPDDTQLVDLEERIMSEEEVIEDEVIAPKVSLETAKQEQVAVASGISQLATRAYGSTIDVLDDWDPSSDDDLAAQFAGARNTVSAATSPLDLQPFESGVPINTAPPVSSTSIGSSSMIAASNSAASTANTPVESEDASIQARRLAARAHQAIAEATREIERQLSSSQPEAGSTPTMISGNGTATFRAEVVDPDRTPIIPDDTAPIATPVTHDVAAEIVAPVVAAVPSVTPTTTAGTSAAEIADELVATGVDRDVADILVATAVEHRVPFMPGRELRTIVRDLVAETIPVSTGWPKVGRAQRIAFVGPSGAGTSSTVAKVAERYAKCGLRVGVISVIAGTPRGALAHANDPLLRRGGLDIQFAADVDQALTAVERLADRDLIVIDTPSSACQDTAACSAVSACLAAMRADDIVLTLPLATSVREASAAAERFRALSVSRLGITKIDESTYIGQLLNFGFRLNVPISLLSEGPAVPEDLRAASSQEIAERILPPNTTST
jgi:flagellar biosynthesis GTPase FlhF